MHLVYVTILILSFHIILFDACHQLNIFVFSWL